MIINTPTGQSARADGYAIRAAANTADVTLITTVQEFAAAVQAIDSIAQDRPDGHLLQEHAAALDLLGRGREKAGRARERRRAGRRRGHRDPPGRRLSTPDDRGARSRGGRAARPVRRACRGRTDVGQPAPTLLSLHKVSPSGAYGGTLDVVIAAKGPGTQWLAGLRAHDKVDVVAPCRASLSHPDRAGGLCPRGRRLRLGTSLLARRRAAGARLPRRDGPRRGLRGPALRGGRGAPQRRRRHRDHRRRQRWASWLGLRRPSEIITRTSAAVVYGCGPMGMLRSITEVATAHGAVAQVAVEESMACGVGVCMTCVMPVRGKDGTTRMVRSCVEGPVFRGDRVRWEASPTAYARARRYRRRARAGGH